MAAGVQLSVLLLSSECCPSGNCEQSSSTATQLEGARCCTTLRQCVSTFLRVFKHTRAGLSSTYYTVLATPHVKRVLNKNFKWDLGKWYPISMTTDGHVTNGQDGVCCNLGPLEQLVGVLSGGCGVDEGEEFGVRREWCGGSDVEREEEGGECDVEREEEGGECDVEREEEGGGCDVEREEEGGVRCELDGGDQEADVDVLTPMANQIHSLMDCAPVKNTDYVVVNVHWIAAGKYLRPPSSTVPFSGALLRLKMWHKTHLELVVPADCPDSYHESLREWEKMVGVDRVWLASDWSPPSGVLWRGGIIAEQQNPQRATQSPILLSEYTLHFSSDVAESALAPSVLQRVGLWPSYSPSHLKLLQAVDFPTVPPYWLSPLHCKLVSTSSSSNLLRTLLSSSAENVGYLFCLCQSPTNPDPDCSSVGPGPRSTSEWVSLIQASESEGELEGDKLHSLSGCETGPVLLVQPPRGPSTFSNQSDYYAHDAWFLRQPDSIDMSAFMLDRAHRRSIKPAPTSNSPPLSSPPSPSLPTFASLRAHWNEGYKRELDVSPLKCVELKALRAHEWIQRKMVKQVDTADLMFGHMPAPPPSHMTGKWVEPSEMLQYFTAQGAPVDTRPLSPIAVTTPSKPTRIRNAAAEHLTYSRLMEHTPRSRKQYHGVDYCLSVEDSSADHRLTTIQQHCLVSERASHCSNVTTPRANRAARRKEAGLRDKRGSGQTAGEKTAGDSTKESTKQQGEDERESAKENSKKKIEKSEGNTVKGKRAKIKLTPKPAAKRRMVAITRTPKRQVRPKRKERVEVNTVVSKEGRNILKVVKDEDGVMQMSVMLRKEEGEGEGVKAAEERNTVAADSTGNPSKKFRGKLYTSVPNVCPADSVSDPVPDTSSISIPNTGLIPILSNSSIPSNMSISIPNASPIPSASSVPRSSSSPATPTSRKLTKKSPRGSRRKQQQDYKRKTMLGQAVVRELKNNGMPRTDPSFKTCYKRLFKLSKVFMEDVMRSSKSSPGSLKTEMQRIVGENVSNVISFHQRLTGNVPQETAASDTTTATTTAASDTATAASDTTTTASDTTTATTTAASDTTTAATTAASDNTTAVSE